MEQRDSNQQPFSVDLDDHWRQWGYQQKKNAVEFLRNNFTQGSDYEVLSAHEKSSPGGDHPRTAILLTPQTALAMQKVIQTPPEVAGVRNLSCP